MQHAHLSSEFLLRSKLRSTWNVSCVTNKSIKSIIDLLIKMSFIFAIPQSVCVSVFVEWSTSLEFGKMDSAVCNKYERNKLEWLASRCVRLKSLKVGSEMMENVDFTIFNKELLQTVNKIELTEKWWTKISDLLSKLDLLTGLMELTLPGRVPESDLVQIICKVPRVTKLTFSVLRITSLLFVAQYCCQLVHLEADTYDLSGEDLIGFCEMAKCTLTLQVIKFNWKKEHKHHDVEHGWIHVLRHFPCLVEFDVGECQFDGECFKAIAECNCLQLFKSNLLTLKLSSKSSLIEWQVNANDEFDMVPYLNAFAHLPYLHLILFVSPRSWKFLDEIGKQLAGNIVVLDLRLGGATYESVMVFQTVLTLLLKYHSKLKKLLLSIKSSNFSYDYIIIYLGMCPELESFSMEIMPVIDFAFLEYVTMTNVPCLKFINLSSSEKLSEKNMRLGEMFKARMPHTETNF